MTAEDLAKYFLIHVNKGAYNERWILWFIEEYLTKICLIGLTSTKARNKPNNMIPSCWELLHHIVI